MKILIENIAYIYQLFKSGPWAWVLALVFLTTGCYMRYDVTHLGPKSVSTSTKSPENWDLGETVTTSSGFQVTGTFGQVADKNGTILTPGWEIEGAFYQAQ